MAFAPSSLILANNFSPLNEALAVLRKKELDNKLPIKKIFLTAITFPALYHRQLIKIGWPLLVVGAVSIVVQHLTIGDEGSYIDEAINLISTAAFVFTLVMAIVGCHRLFIFGPRADEDYKLFEWTGNEIKYAGWWILIAFVTGIIAIPLWLMLVPFFQSGFKDIFDNQAFFYAALGLINIPIYYVISRWSLVLPASATDIHGKDLSWSWGLSSNNGWRLSLLIGFLPFSTDLLFDLLPEEQFLIFDLITSFVWVVIGVIEVGLLSLSYSFISSHQSDNTANK